MRLLSRLFGRRKDDPAPPSRSSPEFVLRAQVDALPRPSDPELQPAPRQRRAARVRWREGSYPMEIVGESYYQDSLIAICGRHTRYGSDLQFEAEIALDPSNPHDPNAVVVRIDGRKVGCLPREQAARVGGQMREEGLDAVTSGARVRGGWRTNQYDEGNYGVRLAIPNRGWIDFGTGREPPTGAQAAPTRAAARPSPAPRGPLSGQWVAIQGEPSDGPLAHELAAAGARIMVGLGKSTTLLVVAEERPFTPGTTGSATYRKAEAANVPIASIADVRQTIAEASRREAGR